MPIVKHTVDLDNLPPLSKDMLAEMDAINDKDIDYSDIPVLDKTFFVRAKRFHEESEEKAEDVRIRLDQDVWEWLKQSKLGLQAQANTILRAVMEHQRRS